MSRQQVTVEPTSGFAELFGTITTNIERVIQGKTEVIQMALLCLLAEGHLLIEDVPGVGKTSLAKAMATSIRCSFGRVQFTPDLLPSDVVGVSVWNRGSGEFEFRPGPIFANVVLGDEINRASPKTQSALLEAMAEGQVTVDGRTYPLQRPFIVIATQNPIEHEGTYPLPDNQLDRFLMRVSVGYPGRDAEIEMLDTHGHHDALDDIGPVVSAAEIEAMVAAVKAVHVAPSLKGYMVDIAEADAAPSPPLSRCVTARRTEPAARGSSPRRRCRSRLRRTRRREGACRIRARPPAGRDT